MKIIGTAEDADRLLEVLMHIVPYINEVTKQMKNAAGLFAESSRDEECQQIMEVLGKEESLARIRKGIEMLSAVNA